MATKDKRFQLFLFGLHDLTANSAEENGVSLSTEVRNRVSRSFWQDEVIDRLRSKDVTIEELQQFANDKQKAHFEDMLGREATYQEWKRKQ